MIIFVIGIAVHIWLNWTPLISYLKNQSRRFSLLTKEFVLAFGVTLVFIIGTLLELPPFQTFLDFQEDVKNSWEKKSQEAPYGHAEESTLATISKQIGQDVNKSINLLNEAKMKGVNENAKLSEIAKLNGVSANDIYKIISPTYKKIKEASKPTSIIYPKEGEGFGRMNLKEVSQKYGVSLEKEISVLKSKGIEANKDTKIKKAADELDITPLELFELFVK